MSLRDGAVLGPQELIEAFRASSADALGSSAMCSLLRLASYLVLHPAASLANLFGRPLLLEPLSSTAFASSIFSASTSTLPWSWRRRTFLSRVTSRNDPIAIMRGA